MWVFILWAGVALDVLRSFNRLVDLELILLRTYSPTDWWDITRTLGPCGGVVLKYGFLGAKILRSEMNFSNNGIKQIETVDIYPSLLAITQSREGASIPSAPLFLRKLVLGISAQASGKNQVAINAFGALIRS